MDKRELEQFYYQLMDDTQIDDAQTDDSGKPQEQL